MIAIYPSTLPGLPIRTLVLKEATTLYKWLHETESEVWQWIVFTDDLSDIAIDRPQKFTAQVNGRVLPQAEWKSYTIEPDDAVTLSFEPKGGIVGGIFHFVGNVVQGVFGLFFNTPNMQNASSARQQGDQLDQATFDTNQAKLNQIIPECFGRVWRVPDLLVQLHQRFENKTQVSYMHLCAGVGNYQIAELLVGSTPIGSFGSDASYKIFGPGDNHDGYTATENWFTSKEVGGTSSASPGLEINETFDVQPTVDSSTFQLGQDDDGTGYITIPTGSGQFPDGWEAGMEVSVYAPVNVDFENDTNGSYINGPADNVQFKLGDILTFSGDITATLKVVSVNTTASTTVRYYLGDVDKGTNINWISSGTHRVNIDVSGTRYVISSTDGTVQSGDSSSDSSDDDNDDSSSSANTGENVNIHRINVHRVVGAENDADWPGFVERTVNDGNVHLSGNESKGGYTATIAACPVNETTSVIEVDIFATQGLLLYNEKGKMREAYVSYDIEYRDMAKGGDFTVVSKRVEDRTANQFGWTDTINLPYKMRPEVRIRKTGADTTGSDDGTLYATIKWYGLKSQLDRPSSYPGVTSVAIQIRTGERLAAQAENKIKFLQTRELPQWNDAGGALTPTRDIAPAFMYMLRLMGYSDDDVDMDELGRLNATWQGRNDYFDMQFMDDGTTLKDALNTCLGVGFAELVIDRGYIVPVRDEKRSTYGQAYNLNNMTSELKISTKLPYMGDSDQHDGVDVAYIDFLTGQKETMPCRPLGSQGLKVLQVTANGIMDRTKAYQYGMRTLMKEWYRNRTFSFSAGFNALNSPYLDFAVVNGDYQSYGQSGQVIGYTVSGSKAILDTDQLWEWGDSNVIGLERPDGSFSGPYTATRGGNDYQVIIDIPDFTPITDMSVDLTRIMFGNTTMPGWEILIQQVSAQGTPQDEQEPECSLTASIYDERVYQYDDAIPD